MVSEHQGESRRSLRKLLGIPGGFVGRFMEFMEFQRNSYGYQWLSKVSEELQRGFEVFRCVLVDKILGSFSRLRRKSEITGLSDRFLKTKRFERPQAVSEVCANLRGLKGFQGSFLWVLEEFQSALGQFKWFQGVSRFGTLKFPRD